MDSMIDVYIKLSPLVFSYLLGIALRRTGVLKKDDGGILLRIVFYVALPSLMLLSLPEAELKRDFLVLPLVAVAIILVTYLIAYFVFRRLRGEPAVFGVTLVGSMIVNTAFIYPFVILMEGKEGFARVAMYDFGNALLVLTLIYYIASRYGDAAENSIGAVKRVIASPPLWALLIGVTLNITGTPVHPNVRTVLTPLGNLMIPLVMMALGIYFSPRLVRPRLLFAVLAVRLGGGLLVAISLCTLFGLEGLTRTVAIVCGASPIGFNTLVYSSIAKLDVDFAASLLSTSIFLAMLYLPALLAIL
jgi:predicted permease